jgi:hypothetical protein
MTKPFLKEVLNQMSEEQVTSLAHKIEKDSFKSILTKISNWKIFSDS